MTVNLSKRFDKNNVTEAWFLFISSQSKSFITKKPDFNQFGYNLSIPQNVEWGKLISMFSFPFKIGYNDHNKKNENSANGKYFLFINDCSRFAFFHNN